MAGESGIMRLICYIYLAYCVIQAFFVPIMGGDSTHVIFTYPKLLIENGYFTEWRYYPTQGYGMLLQWQMLAGSGTTPILAALLFVANATFIDYLGRRYFGTVTGLIAMVLFVTLPICRIVEFYGLSEMLLTFYFLLAMDAYIQRRWTWSAVFCAGMASVDYTGLIFAGGIGLAFCLERLPLKVKLLSVLTFVALASIWYIPNIIEHGNPVHPYFQSAASRVSAGGATEQLSAATAPHRFEFGVLFLIALPCLLLRKWRKRCDTMIVVSLMAVAAIWLMVKTPHARYMLPAMAMLCVPLATGIKRLLRVPLWKDWSFIATGLFGIYLFWVIVPTVPVKIPITQQGRLDMLREFYPMLSQIEMLKDGAWSVDGRKYPTVFTPQVKDLLSTTSTVQVEYAVGYPYAAVKVSEDMRGYRFYIENRIVEHSDDADFIIEPWKITKNFD